MTSPIWRWMRGSRPAGGGLLAAERHEILAIEDARQGALDRALGIEPHAGEPIAEAPPGLAGINAVPEVLRIGDAGRDDHDLVADSTCVLLLLRAGPSAPRGGSVASCLCTKLTRDRREAAGVRQVKRRPSQLTVMYIYSFGVLLNLLRLFGDHPARHAKTVLQGNRFGENLDVGLVGQQVEVAVAGEVDLLAVVLGETRVHLQALQADGDVSGIAEGGPHTAGGFARRSSREFVLLDENDVSDTGSAKVNAMLVPITPPPMTTTDACGKILPMSPSTFRRD